MMLPLKPLGRKEGDSSFRPPSILPPSALSCSAGWRMITRIQKDHLWILLMQMLILLLSSHPHPETVLHLGSLGFKLTQKVNHQGSHEEC